MRLAIDSITINRATFARSNDVNRHGYLDPI